MNRWKGALIGSMALLASLLLATAANAQDTESRLLEASAGLQMWSGTGRPSPSGSPPSALTTPRSPSRCGGCRRRASSPAGRPSMTGARRARGLTGKGHAMRKDLEEMWSALVWASVDDLDPDTIERFIATSAAIRRSIIERGAPVPVADDRRAQTTTAEGE